MFIEFIEERIEYLSNIITQKEKVLKVRSTQRVRASSHKKGYQYYLRENEKDKNGKYIKKSERALACKLAQEEYDAAVVQLACKEYRMLTQFVRFYKKNHLPEEYFNMLGRGKQLLVNPIQQPEEEFLQAWMHQEYEKLPFWEDSPVYLSNRNEKMRSKSEVIIAGILERLEIPYLYEKPLYLNGKGFVRPDFTLLNLNDRQEIYLEHLGMLDNSFYTEKAVAKIAHYENNGYFLGERLIITGETLKNPLDVELVEKKIRNVFRKKRIYFNENK